MPLLSVRTSGRIGTIVAPIINPHNLHIDGFYCHTVHSNDTLILLDIYIRNISPRGIIIDDHQHLSEPKDLVRLKPILDIGFVMEGKNVIASNKKLGKITEYAIDDKSLFIKKFYAQPPVWQSLSKSRLTFDRSSVLEVTDESIVVSGPEEKVANKEINKSTVRLAQDYSASASLISE